MVVCTYIELGLSEMLSAAAAAAASANQRVATVSAVASIGPRVTKAGIGVPDSTAGGPLSSHEPASRCKPRAYSSSARRSSPSVWPVARSIIRRASSRTVSGGRYAAVRRILGFRVGWTHSEA